jgi:hypothetical protein
MYELPSMGQHLNFLIVKEEPSTNKMWQNTVHRKIDPISKDVLE